MIARNVTPPDRLSSAAAADALASLAELMSLELTSCRALQLEAPSTNAGSIYYGSEAAQPMALAPGERTEVLPITSLQNVYVIGDGTNTVSVLVFR